MNLFPRPAVAALLLLLPSALRGDVVVVFNEVMYHPAGTDAATKVTREWVELRNQMTVDIELSGWRLAGAVDFVFAKGTILPGGAHLVVAANPAAFQAHTGVGGALGPWAGQLSNDGERIELRNNHDRVMDALDYGTSGRWPTAPDGGGASLVKARRNLASDDPLSWQSSRAIGGTPGAENFPAFFPPVTTTPLALDGVWRYRADGVDLGTSWRAAAFADEAWSGGAAAFQLGAGVLPAPAAAGTALPGGPVTYYFRRHFTFGGQAQFASVRVKMLVDDGAAVFLNGTELVRTNLPPGALAYATPASNPRRAAPGFQEFTAPGNALVAGDNVLAVEVHQAALLPSYASAVLSAGPVAYWRLGESSGAAADLADVAAAPESGAQPGAFQNLLPASLANAGPRPADGLAGFDALNSAPFFQGNNDGGNDVVTFPDPGVLNFSAGKKFTVSAWVKGATTQESGAAIFCKGTGGGGEQFSLDVVGGRFRFFVWNGGSPNAATVATSTFGPNNAWQHLAVVFDSAAGAMRLYVNGALTASATPPATLVNTTHEISVGARKGSAGASYDLNFDGLVDEVAVFARALSPAEITAQFNAASTPSPSGTDATDAVFAAELSTIEVLPVPAPPTLALNEVSTIAVELFNFGSAPIDLSGCRLLRVSGTSASFAPLPAQVLAPGTFLQLGHWSFAGDRLLLLGSDGATVLDSTDVKSAPRARVPDGNGAWLHPTAATPGAANVVALHGEVVINEIMYDPPAAALLPPAMPLAGQWIELHNRSASAVDLSGWKMSGGIGFTFPAGTSLTAGGFLVVAENPAALSPAALGPWSGSLSRSGERLVLEDALGNPADEVHFHNDGRWPEAADAGGSSLELRDALADNDAGEAWAASDETAKAGWQTFTWRGANNSSQTGEPTLWHELDLLLVDGAGDCLIDDVRVTDLTTGANLIQNGNLNAGAAHWRFLGNHRTSRVEPEPGNAANPVLHLIASGPGEYQGNQIESTFLGNQALVEGRQYEISLRARWLSGGGRLNTRLYFNRLPRTNLLAVSPRGGTPGAVNSRAVANIGPTFHGLAHSPVVPAANQPVTISVEAADPQGIAAIALKYSVAGGAWLTAPMTLASGARYTATLAGFNAGAVVQFYIEARDALGATTFFPARGANSRALFQVDDGQSGGPLPLFRLLMTSADATFLHTPINTLSNESLGCTVIADGGDVYYDAGVRLKGSFVGRNVARVGFNLRFPSDRLFRGVLDKIAIDRSMHTAINNPAELIVKHIASAAGGIPNMYDDLARFVHPIASYTGVASVRLAAFENEYLDSQFAHGGEGTMFEHEVLRWALATVDGNPESPKQPGNEGSGTGYANIELTDFGNDKEAYRWSALQTSHRDLDDFTRMIALEKTFALSGAAFLSAAPQQLDVAEWLRTLAFQSLVGAADAAYLGTAVHNFRIYFRPADGRALYLPWDWDSAFLRATNGSLIGAGNIAKVVNASPDFTRRYLHELSDLIATTFNTNSMARWTQHYGTLAGQDYSAYLTYIGQRAAYVLSQLPTATSFAAVAGTVNAQGVVTITGNANIAVAFIEVNGLAYTPTWTSNTAWTIAIPLAAGANPLTIRGLDSAGVAVAGASTTLNVTNPNGAAWPALRFNEWMAANQGSVLDPADNDRDDWFEIFNPTAQPVSLAGWKITRSPANPTTFVVPNGWTIPANGFLLVWADNEPAQTPATPSAGAHLHVTFRLSQTGETLQLNAPDSAEIDRITFGPQLPDLAEGRYPDGAPALQPLTLPSPGAANIFARYVTLALNASAPFFTISTTPGTVYQLETSPDLQTWSPASDPFIAPAALLTFPLTMEGTQRFFRVWVSD